jgi:hypothetical protein
MGTTFISSTECKQKVTESEMKYLGEVGIQNLLTQLK